MKLSVLLFCILFMSLPSRAHDVVSDDPYSEVFHMGRLIELVSQMQISPTNPQQRSTLTSVQVGGRTYYLNTAFFEAMELITLAYMENLKSACPTCDIPTEEQIQEELRARSAESLVRRLGMGTLDLMGRTIIRPGVRMAGEFGPLGGILVAMFEVAEEIFIRITRIELHFACQTFQTLLIYYYGRLTTTYRVWRDAPGLGRNGLRQLARLAGSTLMMRRSFRRIRLHMGPIEVDPRLFEHGENGRQDELGHWLAHEIEDERNFAGFFERVEQLTGEYRETITRLEAEKENARGLRLNRIHRQIRRAQRKLDRAFEVRRRVFEGRGDGRFFFLKRINQPMTLYSGEIATNRLFRGDSRVWMVPLSSNIAEPGLQISERATQTELREFQERLATLESPELPERDQILLAEARESGTNIEMMAKLFGDIERVFDTSRPTRERRMHWSMMYGFFNEFMRNLNNKFVRQATILIYNNNQSVAQYRANSAFEYKAARLNFRAREFVDYLNGVHLVAGRNAMVFESSHAKDFMLKLFKGYRLISELQNNPTPQKLERVSIELTDLLHEIHDSRFWVNKPATIISHLPSQVVTRILGLRPNNIFRMRPQCSALY
jgi:hypothetical protein